MQYAWYLVDTSDSLGAVPGPVTEEPAWEGEPRSAIHSWTREAKPLILNPFKNSHRPWNLNLRRPQRPKRARLSASFDFPDLSRLATSGQRPQRVATILFALFVLWSTARGWRDYCTLEPFQFCGLLQTQGFVIRFCTISAALPRRMKIQKCSWTEPRTNEVLKDSAFEKLLFERNYTSKLSAQSSTKS